MRMLTTRDAAQLLQTSRDTVVRLCNSGELPFERVRSVGHRRIRLDNLLAFAKRNGISLNLAESDQK